MPGMIPVEKLPIEKAIDSLSSRSESILSLSFCQSLVPLVMGRSCICLKHDALTDLVESLKFSTLSGSLLTASNGTNLVGSLFVKILRRCNLGDLDTRTAGLLGFPDESLTQALGRFFAGESSTEKVWVILFDYQPNHLGLLLALCAAFPANHRFYFPSLPGLLPRFDSENLLNLLLKDNFKNIKVDGARKSVTTSIKSGVFPRVAGFIPGPVWEDLVGEHLENWDLAKIQQECAWSLASNVDKVCRSWSKLDSENWEKFDRQWCFAEYKGWKVSALAPNGGITDVSVFNGCELWGLPTTLGDLPIDDGDRFGTDDKGKLFTDKLWHLALAQNFIDWNVEYNSRSVSLGDAIAKKD